MDKEYLNNVINHIVKNITIDSSSTDKFHPKGKIFFPWLPFPLSISREILSFFDSNDPWNARPNFHKYCRDNFGLNGKEMKIVLDKLNFIIKDKVKDLYDLPISRFNKLNESTEGKQKEFFDKILDRIVKDTNITDSKITFPFAIFKQEELTGDSLLSVSIWMDNKWENHKYPSRFNKYCMDNYGLTYEESLILWRRYMEIIEKEVLNRLRKNKSNVATIWGMTRHDINESVDKQKKLLDYVYTDLVNNTKFRDNESIEIDVYDGKCKSLQAGIRWGSVAPYFNFISGCLEEFLKNTYGLTYGEIQELFWDRYDEHIINMVLTRKERISPYIRGHVDYLKEGKETGFIKKVVSRMVDETVPYNKREGVTSVVTPFVAHKETGSRWVLSPNYCKRIVDDFDDNFTMGKIFIDYLDMYGLSYEEMEEVLYWYFNEIFEKYFKRFYDLSYKTRPRLDEGVDLGFVDKVADRVLKEIVWDYDRGFVYFPMIDYSANIRDDDFLAPLMSDDPFSIHFRERNETSWHDDLMKHVEDIYGITGNEWNRVWGSLQGELWDKHVDWWNTFTSGY